MLILFRVFSLLSCFSYTATGALIFHSRPLISLHGVGLQQDQHPDFAKREERNPDSTRELRDSSNWCERAGVCEICTKLKAAPPTSVKEVRRSHPSRSDLPTPPNCTCSTQSARWFLILYRAVCLLVPHRPPSLSASLHQVRANRHGTRAFQKRAEHVRSDAAALTASFTGRKLFDRHVQQVTKPRLHVPPHRHPTPSLPYTRANKHPYKHLPTTCVRRRSLVSATPPLFLSSQHPC